MMTQVGGALELAEQISREEMPDPSMIVLAVGSGLAKGVEVLTTRSSSTYYT